jgi:hypothetical protein
MKFRTPAGQKTKAARRRHQLRAGQSVELTRGALAGLTGVVIGFHNDHRCVIELNNVAKGVLLLTDVAAAKYWPREQIE